MASNPLTVGHHVDKHPDGRIKEQDSYVSSIQMFLLVVSTGVALSYGHSMTLQTQTKHVTTIAVAVILDAIMVVAIVFILLFWCSNKMAELHIKPKLNLDDPDETPIPANLRMKVMMHKNIEEALPVIGVVVFYISGAFLDVLKIVSRVACMREYYQCGPFVFMTYVLSISFHLLRFVFMGFVMVFCYVFHSRVMQRCTRVRYGLLLVVAAAIVIWFDSVLNDSNGVFNEEDSIVNHRECRVLYQNGTVDESDKFFQCLNETTSLHANTSYWFPILYPLNIEFLLLAIEILLYLFFTAVPGEKIREIQNGSAATTGDTQENHDTKNKDTGSNHEAISEGGETLPKLRIESVSVADGTLVELGEQDTTLDLSCEVHANSGSLNDQVDIPTNRPAAVSNPKQERCIDMDIHEDGSATSSFRSETERQYVVEFAQMGNDHSNETQNTNNSAGNEGDDQEDDVREEETSPQNEEQEAPNHTFELFSDDELLRARSQSTSLWSRYCTCCHLVRTQIQADDDVQLITDHVQSGQEQPHPTGQGTPEVVTRQWSTKYLKLCCCHTGTRSYKPVDDDQGRSIEEAESGAEELGAQSSTERKSNHVPRTGPTFFFFSLVVNIVTISFAGLTYDEADLDIWLVVYEVAKIAYWIPAIVISLNAFRVSNNFKSCPKNFRGLEMMVIVSVFGFMLHTVLSIAGISACWMGTEPINKGEHIYHDFPRGLPELHLFALILNLVQMFIQTNFMAHAASVELPIVGDSRSGQLPSAGKKRDPTDGRIPINKANVCSTGMQDVNSGEENVPSSSNNSSGTGHNIELGTDTDIEEGASTKQNMGDAPTDNSEEVNRGKTKDDSPGAVADEQIPANTAVCEPGLVVEIDSKRGCDSTIKAHDDSGNKEHDHSGNKVHDDSANKVHDDSANKVHDDSANKAHDNSASKKPDISASKAPVQTDISSTVSAGTRKQTHDGEEVRNARRSFRNALIYMAMCNAALWGIDSFVEMKNLDIEPIQVFFYGKDRWHMLVHMLMPLTLFYRFNSCIIFAKIFLNKK